MLKQTKNLVARHSVRGCGEISPQRGTLCKGLQRTGNEGSPEVRVSPFGQGVDVDVVRPFVLSRTE